MPRETKELPGRLLVADDNKVNRLLLGRELEQMGHAVTFAENGRQAIERLRAGTFDLVLCDLVMPEMDGIEVLEELARDPVLRDVPVVMVSAQDEIETVVRCIEMGAEDYLFKPFNHVLLRARVGASLEKKRLRDQQREYVRKFATREVADQLLSSGFALGGTAVDATVMFADIRSFTSMAESQTPADTIELLNTYYALTFDAIENHGGVVNQILGDGLMALFGAPIPRPNHREQAVRAAAEMLELIQQFNQDRLARGQLPIQIGVGIASGNVIAGYTGTQQRATYTCVGDTVNLAARLEQHTKVVGKPLLIDAGTREGLPADIAADDIGLVSLRGKAQPVHVFAVGVDQGAR